MNIKLGFKAWDKWTITLASYNTFSSKVEKYNPYKAGLEAALENLVPPGRHQDFYNYRLDKFLSYSESSNINKIQLGVGCFVTKNKEIQIDLFIDPFNERNNNNSSLIISFNQRF